MRALLFTLSAALLATPAAAQTFTGDTTGAATYNRTLSGSPPPGYSAVGTAVQYNVLSFSVTAGGSYDFLLTGVDPAGWDTFLTLYSGSFDPSAGLTNALIANDDFPTIGLSGFSYALDTGTSYFAVVSGFGNDDAGAWDLQITGPGTAILSGAIPEPATWGLMILGFGAVGGAMRARRKATVRFA